MARFKRLDIDSSRGLFAAISPLGRGNFSSQASEIFSQLRQLALGQGFSIDDVVFVKFFLSDSCNQDAELRHIINGADSDFNCEAHESSSREAHEDNSSHCEAHESTSRHCEIHEGNFLHHEAQEDTSCHCETRRVVAISTETDCSASHQSHAALPPCAISIIEQQPLDGSKINAIFWLVQKEGLRKRIEGGVFVAEDGVMKHIFHTPAPLGGDSLSQTLRSFEENERVLQGMGASTAGNCVRTWLHVRDIDMNYAGAVKARNGFFSTIGLTADTHFIASTGIEGTPGLGIVSTDFYSVAGLRPEQVSYLSAPEYLNATHEYGVAFERGAAVDYGACRHVFISGTASIDSAGRCINLGDPAAQTRRILLIISKLLEKAQARLSDTCLMIVYLRDSSDYQCVAGILAEQCPGIPHVIVRAPVCRPQWLVEIECFAIAGE